MAEALPACRCSAVAHDATAANAPDDLTITLDHHLPWTSALALAISPPAAVQRKGAIRISIALDTGRLQQPTCRWRTSLARDRHVDTHK